MPSTRKVVLITAASKGIGRAIAERLSSEWDVVLLARSEQVLATAEQMGGVGVAGSLTEPADLARFVQTAVGRYGRIDALVNNTGHPAKGELLKLSDTDWQQGFDLILQSAIRLTQLVLPVMIRQKHGAIVNISSYTARKPELERPVSSVFRAALSAWTRLQAEYGAPHGIRANSVLSGFVDSYPVEQSIIDAIPMGRIGKLQELANFVAFLLSEDASYLTGQNLLLDGGLVRAQ